MKRIVAVVALCLGASLAIAGVSPSTQVDVQAKLAMGDVNLDQVVDSYDVLAILDWQSGLVALSQEQLRNADLNGDGAADIDDAALLLGRAQVGENMLIRRVQMTVDPLSGVQEMRVFNPLESLQQRLSPKAVETRDTAVAGNMPWLDWDQPGSGCLDCNGTIPTCVSRTVSARFVWDDSAQANQLFAPATTISQHNFNTGGSYVSHDPYTFICESSDCNLVEDGESFRLQNVVDLDGTCNSFTFFYDFTASVDVGDTE